MTELSDETKPVDFSLEGVIESMKTAMCETRCKFPEQYNANEDDIAFETMLHEKCNYCPLNIF